MLKHFMLAGISLLLLASPIYGKEPDSCRTPRIADGGWTDNTAQNALAMTVLRHLGYEPKDQLLSVPVILESLKNQQIDIWLDNWMPSQTTEVTPYLEAKTIESHAVNLEGAGYGPVGAPCHNGMQSEILCMWQEVKQWREWVIAACS